MPKHGSCRSGLSHFRMTIASGTNRSIQRLLIIRCQFDSPTLPPCNHPTAILHRKRDFRGSDRCSLNGRAHSSDDHALWCAHLSVSRPRLGGSSLPDGARALRFSALGCFCGCGSCHLLFLQTISELLSTGVTQFRFGFAAKLAGKVQGGVSTIAGHHHPARRPATGAGHLSNGERARGTVMRRRPCIRAIFHYGSLLLRSRMVASGT